MPEALNKVQAAISEAAETAVPAAQPTFRPNPAIATALRESRHEAALCLMNSVAKWEKYRPQIEAVQDLKEYLRRDYSFMVEYLQLRFQTGDLTYRNLYVGDKVRQAFFEPEAAVDMQIARRRQIIDADKSGLLALFKTKLVAADLAALGMELDEIARVLTTRAARSLEVLLIGDCIYLDVTAFLTGACLQDEISINPTLVMGRNPAELRALTGRKFDLVFFSPFTYEYSPEYNQLMWWHQGAMPAAKIQAVAESAFEDAKSTIATLCDQFDCNIFVHNSAHLRRHDGSARERLANMLSWRARRAGRKHVNQKLAHYVAQRNAAGTENLFLFDEALLLQEHGESKLGRVFYDHDSRHPAAMGKWVADRYQDLLAIHANLLKKKVVVCDLDNTLWNGVIGEGAVQHYLDKQRILKKLQAKGVVLAINSKNDPKNIKWEGSILNAEDFVSSQINWDNKVLNLQRIAQHLNLKSKDFVFIDDRADEREMAKSAMPEVQVLDALSDRSWRLLDLWSALLVGADSADRTRLYKEKEARDGFMQSQPAIAEDPATMFQKLGLTVTVRDAKKSDLKRVVELINRTNQFNTCGSRTSIREVGDWLASGNYRILVVDCADKFGTMGTICICVIHTLPDRIEIPIFVLSCRVFGYGIENVMVNSAKRIARQAGVPVVGLYQETAYNEPCRKTYPDNGFLWQGAQWIWNDEGAIVDPSWLAITVQQP